MAKLHKGSKVRLTERTPERLGFDAYMRSRPRTVIALRYRPERKAVYYRLGSNGKGMMKDGDPQTGFDYEFRSYMLEPYQPRHYHFKRQYRRSVTAAHPAENLPIQNSKILPPASKTACCQAEEIIAKAFVGWYCHRCKMYYREAELIRGTCPECGGSVIPVPIKARR